MRRNGALRWPTMPGATACRARRCWPGLPDRGSRGGCRVCRHPARHPCFLRAGRRRGGKPAYVEKPMARNAAECKKMVEAFARARLPLFVAYYRRRLPLFLKVEELIRSGALGPVTGVTYRLAEPHHRKGNIGTDVACGLRAFLTPPRTRSTFSTTCRPLTDIGTAANVAVGLRSRGCGGVQLPVGRRGAGLDGVQFRGRGARRHDADHGDRVER